MRRCRKCDQPATANKGPATCEGCRVRSTNYVRPVRLLVCVCGRKYRTKSGNRLCPSCQHERKKHPCSDCGEPCDKRAKRCLKCSAPKAGETNPNWKGGRTVNGLTGYVRVKAPDHPRAKHSGGWYVLEHILIVEERIGRYLLPGENVHHRNGIRDDNRSDNLELWVKSQPAGQRVSDLLEWAYEIIETYDGLES